MMIGRTDERQNPLESKAIPCREFCLDIARGTHLGQRSSRRVKQAGHMTAFERTSAFCKFYLNPAGRPHMNLGEANESGSP
jgi:hypothetical protein